MEARGPYCPVDLVKLVTMLKDAALPWRESMCRVGCFMQQVWGEERPLVCRVSRSAPSLHRPAQPSRLGGSLLLEAIIKVK
jgi:hypothetical protein